MKQRTEAELLAAIQKQELEACKIGKYCEVTIVAGNTYGGYDCAIAKFVIQGSDREICLAERLVGEREWHGDLTVSCYSDNDPSGVWADSRTGTDLGILVKEQDQFCSQSPNPEITARAVKGVLDEAQSYARKWRQELVEDVGLYLEFADCQGK